MKILNNQMDHFDLIGNIKSEFQKTGMVDITALFDINFIAELTDETLRVFNDRMQRKDFLMSHTENTPRNMFSVSERTIHETSIFIPDFYNHEDLVNIMTAIAGEKVMPLPWAGEKYVINGLAQAKDTHGWHWDDYSYALIFVAKAPPKENGGLVECIPNTIWNRAAPKISKILSERIPATYYFESGSFYFMKSDTTLHRVTPVIDSSLRVAIAMSWCNQSDLIKDIDHKTVLELYGS